MSQESSRGAVATAVPGVPPTAAATAGTLSPAARAAVAAGMPANTLRAYRESLDRYAAWCTAQGLEALPATADSLTEYATWAAYTKGWAPVTIERARWAIIKWHKLAGLPPPSTEGLVGVLKGYRDHLATTHSPKAVPRQADPARKDILAAMTATLDRSALPGQRDAAIILVGFAIGARRSEIASLDVGSIRFEARGMEVTVYRKKTRKMDKAVVRYRADQALCPVRAARDLADALAARGRTDGPLFLRIDRHGNLAHPMMRHGRPIGDPAGRITGQTAADVIHRCAVTAGLSGLWTGHSLRRGLATTMHEAGHARGKIEQQGGWTPDSTAVTGYIDDAERWLYDVLEGVL